MTKHALAALAVTLIGGAAAGPAIAADVGISINIGEPGFYGRLDVGDFPQPAIIYSQPVLIERTSGYDSRARRSTCMCHQAMKGIGASTAANTTPAGNRFTLCETGGTSRPTWHAIATAIAAPGTTATATMAMANIVASSTATNTTEITDDK